MKPLQQGKEQKKKKKNTGKTHLELQVSRLRWQGNILNLKDD